MQKITKLKFTNTCSYRALAANRDAQRGFIKHRSTNPLQAVNKKAVSNTRLYKFYTSI